MHRVTNQQQHVRSSSIRSMLAGICWEASCGTSIAALPTATRRRSTRTPTAICRQCNPPCSRSRPCSSQVSALYECSKQTATCGISIAAPPQPTHPPQHTHPTFHCRQWQRYLRPQLQPPMLLSAHRSCYCCSQSITQTKLCICHSLQNWHTDTHAPTARWKHPRSVQVAAALLPSIHSRPLYTANFRHAPAIADMGAPPSAAAPHAAASSCPNSAARCCSAANLDSAFVTSLTAVSSSSARLRFRSWL
jgi:hypothetical protein